MTDETTPNDDSEYEEKLKLLQKILIMTRLDKHQQNIVAARLHHASYKANQMIFDEGEPGRRLYMIVSGTVLVTKANPPMDRKLLAELGPGNFFGEIALLKNVPRTARVTAKTDCQFLFLEAKDFLHCYEHFPPHVCDDIQIIIKKRLEEQNIHLI